MTRTVATIALVLIVIGAARQPVLSAGETTVRFRVDTATFLDPETISIDIVAGSDTPFNAAAVAFSYPADILAVDRIELDAVACDPLGMSGTLLPPGQASFICASYTRMTGEQTLGRITFRKLSAGWADLEFADGSLVLSADGRGTPIDFLPEHHRLEIVK